MGFKVRPKPFTQCADGSAKGNWGVDIMLDAIEYAAHADVVVLLGHGAKTVLLKIQARNQWHSKLFDACFPTGAQPMGPRGMALSRPS
ncbi:hypothetical protein [Chromohalobacter israelensis]|uniref:hypothetical protein n=1 Tax=Chromohalobacter israelensis TaxID=141390 RepID=UPI00351D253C